MGIPTALSNFANPIVEKALETGARGQTVTATNYGVIGDAMFKKAQLDLGVAQLQSDAGMQKAQLLSGIEMNKASLKLQEGQIMGQAQMNAYNIKQQEKANNPSDIEKIMGSISGVASGAVTGFVLGGPAGAVAGGAIGGIATYAGYQSGGRQGGMAAQQMLGNIANATVSIKGLVQEKKSSDALSSIVKTGADLYAATQKPGTTEERYAAQQAFDAHVAAAPQIMMQAGMNPQQAMTFGQQYRKSFDSSNSLSDPSNKAMSQMHENAVNFASTPAEQITPAMRKSFIAQQNVLYSDLHGGKSMPKELAYSMLESAQPGQGDLAFNSPRSIGSMQQPQNRGSMQAQQAPSSTQPMQLNQPTNNIQQAPAPVSYPSSGTVNDGSHVPWAPNPSAGVTMDDGMDMFQKPVVAETNLAKMGANAVDSMAMNSNRVEHAQVPMGWDGANSQGVNSSVTTDSPKVKSWKDGTGVPEAWKQMDDAQIMDAEVPMGASVEQKHFMVEKKIDATKNYVEATIKNVNVGDSKGAINQKQAILSAKDDLSRYNTAVNSLPDGAVKRLFASAQEKGKVSEVMGALGGIAGIALGPAAMVAKLGIGYLGSKVGAGLDAPISAIAKAGLSPAEKDSIIEMANVRRDLASELISAGRADTKTPRLEEERAYYEQLPSPGEDPATRQRKMLSVLDGFKSSVDGFVTTFGSEGTSGGVDYKQQKDSLDVQIKRNTLKLQQQRMMKQQDKNGIFFIN